MASESPAPPVVAANSRPQVPVGLRILSLWGTPVRGWMNRWNRKSAFALSVLSSLLLLATIYGIGAVLAWHYGVLSPFLASPLVPALLAATGWSAIWIAWASAVYLRWGYGFASGPDATAQASVPHLTDGQRKNLETHWHRICSVRTALKYAAVPIAIVVLYAYVSIYPPAGTFQFFAAPASVRALYAFPDQTYWMFVYLAAVAAILADVGSFGLFFTFEHLRFVSQFVDSERALVGTPKSNTVPLIYLARKPLEELASASFLSSMGWFGAVAILVAVFAVDVNVLTLFGVTVLVAIGLYVFLQPQWEFHRLIQSAKGAALSQLENKLGKDWYDPATQGPKPEHLLTLVLAQNVAAMSDWHVDLRLVVAQIVAAAVPFALAFFHAPLGLG